MCVVTSLPEKVEQGPVRTILHDYAVAGALGADAPEPDHVGVVQLAQVVDRGLVGVLHLKKHNQGWVNVQDKLINISIKG